MPGNDKTPLAKISDTKQTSTPFALSLLGFLLPNLSSGPLLDTQPCLDRPSTPLGFRAEDDGKEQEAQESYLSHDEGTDGCVPDIVCPVPRTEVLHSIAQEVTESRGTTKFSGTLVTRNGPDGKRSWKKQIFSPTMEYRSQVLDYLTNILLCLRQKQLVVIAANTYLTLRHLSIRELAT